MIRIAIAGVAAAFFYMTLMPIVGNLRVLPDLNKGGKKGDGPVLRAGKAPTEKSPEDFKDPDELFAARFPVPSKSSRQGMSHLGGIERLVNAHFGGVAYSVAIHDLGYDLSTETAFNLKWLSDRCVTRAGVKADKPKILRVGETFNGFELGGRWDGNSARVWRCRLYIVRQFAVVVEVVGPTDDFDAAEAAAFFDSFQLTDKALDMPPYRPQRRRAVVER